MMLEQALSDGHVKRIPPDSHAMRVGTIDEQDNVTIPLIEQFMRRESIPVTRIEIIRSINTGTARIDRCLRKMHKDGTLNRTATRGSTLWELASK
jgi:hypothetical protein